MQEQMQDQEIDLREYINVIIKRKWVILPVFFIAVISAAVINFLTPTPKVYVATAVIQSGNVDGPLIAKAEAKEIIKSQDILSSVIKKSKIDITDIASLKKTIEIEDIKNTSFFRLIVKSEGADTPVKICRTIIDSYFDFGKPIYQERIKLLDNQVKEIDNQLENIKNATQSLRKIIHTFSLSLESNETTSEPRIIFLQETLSNYASQISSLTSKKNALNLVQIKAKEFKVIDAPLRRKRPLKPKKRRNVILAGVVSLMLGIFLAFFIEYRDKSNKQH